MVRMAGYIIYHFVVTLDEIGWICGRGFCTQPITIDKNTSKLVKNLDNLLPEQKGKPKKPQSENQHIGNNNPHDTNRTRAKNRNGVTYETHSCYRPDRHAYCLCQFWGRI